MRRRDFIKAVAGSAMTWPLVVRAQQAMPVIGFLAPVRQNEELLHGFQQGLQHAGFVEGDNVSILYRSVENEMDRLPALAIDLARRGVAVIVAISQQAAFAAKNATATIPVLFVAVEDPVKVGLVASLARPDGNLTGVNILATELVAKRPVWRCLSILPIRQLQNQRCKEWSRQPAPWACKFRFSMPATAGRSVLPSPSSSTSGPTRCSSA